KERLVVENDERIYNLKDCLNLHEKAGIPIVADYLHHRLNNNGERFSEILKDVIKTWKIKDGPPIVDYSSLKLSGRKGSHAEKINLKDFYSFLKEVLKVTSCIDIMLEIKDKEKSTLKAINFIKRKSLWKVQEYI
ncbi:MAG: UV DNA damage repair endonuclease UvsE, partial [candidate division WOR-3 bacterium]